MARTVDVVGDKWTLLILRDAFEGLTRFTQFQRSLGVAKNILSARLHQLVEADVLSVRPDAGGSAYHEYVLTPRGEALFHLVVALREWGADNAFDDEGAAQHLRRREDRRIAAAVALRDARRRRDPARAHPTGQTGRLDLTVTAAPTQRRR